SGFWCVSSPGLIEGTHVKRLIILFILIGGIWRVCVAVKLSTTVCEVPYFCVVGMKNMCAVFMDIYTFIILTIDIPSYMFSFVNHNAFFSGLFGLVCKNGSKESSSYN